MAWHIADVIAGTLLALAAYAVFLRTYSGANIPEGDRGVAPALALCVAGVVLLGLGGFWVVYTLGAWR